MVDHLDKISTYQFLTAFPQIISRICHPQPDTFIVLKVSSIASATRTQTPSSYSMC